MTGAQRRHRLQGAISMSFTQAVGSVLRQYATFTGRARRSEYWWFYLFTFLVSIAASVVDAVLGVVIRNDLGVVSLLSSLAFLLPSIAVGVRRLHDTGRTGWWMLLPLVPGLLAFVLAIPALFLGIFSAANGETGVLPVLTIAIFLLGLVLAIAAGIVLIVFFCLDSKPGPNKYGPSPKEPLPPWGYSPPAGGPSGTYGPYSPQPGGYYPPQG
jgi:uncharacterized membrane protein YhaH (DUF805 family)